MELNGLIELGRLAAFSFAAGVNLYATVAMIGLAARFDWVDLPAQFALFDNGWVIGAALALYLVEFFADKIPYVDTLWDVLHTAIRPLGGALIAVASLGDASPGVQGLAALLGGTLAASSHFTKAGTRAAVNTSPEPLSNWLVSLAEDGFVVGLGLLALNYPVAALAVVLVLVVVIVACAAALVRAIRRRFARAADAATGGAKPVLLDMWRSLARRRGAAASRRCYWRGEARCS